MFNQFMSHSRLHKITGQENSGKKNIHVWLCLVLMFVFGRTGKSQDLLDLLENEAPKKEFVKNAFKSTRVINGHSMEMLGAGVLDFRIMHRFGRLNGGAYNLYGLDQATIRFGFDYGISKRLTAGIGRSSSKKELDGFLKYRLIWQSTGEKSIPFSVLLVSGMTMNMLKQPDVSEKPYYYSNRLGYYYQAIIGRKFSEKFSLQLTPTFVHRNYVQMNNDPNDVYAVGLGSRIKLSKRIALTEDFYYVINKSASENFQNCLSLGIDIETGGHVFQIQFTNALGMNERAFITETDGNWGKGDIQLGFNISRVFTIVDNRKSKQ
ncbi:MAG: DUF5777 family beta-barrel protein [Bacteroidota bacterium]